MGTSLNPMTIIIALLTLTGIINTVPLATSVNAEEENVNTYGDLLWSDEFNDDSGKPNDRHWSYDVGGWGWGNGEFQEYREENAAVEGGRLLITARRMPTPGPSKDGAHNFSSARIKTAGKLSVLYGTIEARLNIPNVYSGLWPAFWTLGESFYTENVSWPACGELDIAEFGAPIVVENKSTPNNHIVVGAVHTASVDGKSNRSVSSWTTLPYDLNGTFHIYRMEWTPSFVRMTVDNDNVALYKDISVMNCSDCGPLHQAHYLLLNLAVGGKFTWTAALGKQNDDSRITATLPATLEVDYVRIYDNCFTRLSGPAFNGTINSSRMCKAPVDSGSLRPHHVQVWSVVASIAAAVASLWM